VFIHSFISASALSRLSSFEVAVLILVVFPCRLAFVQVRARFSSPSSISVSIERGGPRPGTSETSEPGLERVQEQACLGYPLFPLLIAYGFTTIPSTSSFIPEGMTDA